MGKTM